MTAAQDDLTQRLAWCNTTVVAVRTPTTELRNRQGSACSIDGISGRGRNGERGNSKPKLS